MAGSGTIGIIIILVTLVFSYKGFSDSSFFERYKFEVDKVLIYKDYKRLITSGFLHVNWTHLIFNLLTIYLFSGVIESSVGEINFLVIYFSSLVGGDLLTLFIHRNHPDYSSVGASGAISGIMFASIALFPSMGMGFFFLPISFPIWLYGILFIGFSIYAITSKRENIGHEAHLGGALIGMLIAIILQPSALINNYLTILIILIPTVAFIYLIITRPHLLLIDNFFFKKHKDYYSIDHKYNEQKATSQQEVDRILDKISSKGINSLSRTEKDKLKEYSRKVR